MTEDEPENCVARQITELCQQRGACGFIYVLNGSLPAEEAAQVVQYRYVLTCFYMFRAFMIKKMLLFSKATIGS